MILRDSRLTYIIPTRLARDSSMTGNLTACFSLEFRDATNLGKDLDLGPKSLDLNLDLYV